MRRIVWCLVLAMAVTEASPAVRSQSQAGVWDGVYAKVAAGAFEHNAFLARIAAGRSPGRALDIGIGEGRNAFFLASQGWDVTGFDASAAGIKLTVAEAAKRRLRVTALVADVDSFDYGQERWDLVAGLYMHEMITTNAAKIVASMKPGGILIVEGMHHGAMGTGVGGTPYGHRPNELLRAFEGLRVVFYEEAMAPPYWMPRSPAVPIVRFAATR
jgi:SAM-dependent methyltransferase